jgi:hypothetical protein
MKFNFENSFIVPEKDIEKMISFVEEKGYSIEDSIDLVTSNWGELEYYAEFWIHDQLIKEIEKRLQKNKEKG